MFQIKVAAVIGDYASFLQSHLFVAECLSYLYRNALDNDDDVDDCSILEYAESILRWILPHIIQYHDAQLLQLHEATHNKWLKIDHM
jgi:hypothetical protein